MAVLPSAEIATHSPCAAPPTALVPTSLPLCCAHTPALRVNTHAAPLGGVVGRLPSSGPPMIAVLPSAEIATDSPCREGPTAPVPTSLLPCCDHKAPVRVNTHAAPT